MGSARRFHDVRCHDVQFNNGARQFDRLTGPQGFHAVLAISQVSLIEGVSLVEVMSLVAANQRV